MNESKTKHYVLGFVFVAKDNPSYMLLGGTADFCREVDFQSLEVCESATDPVSVNNQLSTVIDAYHKSICRVPQFYQPLTSGSCICVAECDNVGQKLLRRAWFRYKDPFSLWVAVTDPELLDEMNKVLDQLITDILSNVSNMILSPFSSCVLSR